MIQIMFGIAYVTHLTDLTNFSSFAIHIFPESTVGPLTENDMEWVEDRWLIVIELWLLLEGNLPLPNLLIR